jgi:uncharacterized membrane protein
MALILLRIVHIGFAVFWAGSVFFMSFLLGPAATAAGPDGFAVMRELHRRHYFGVMLGAGTLTILSGLDLMRRDSAGFSPSWFHSSFGIGLSTGMVATLIAFLLALIGIRPTLRRLLALGTEMAQAAPEARGAIAAQLGAARGRMMAFSMVATLFMIIAVLAMATARYL